MLYRVPFDVAACDVERAKEALFGKPYPGDRSKVPSEDVPPDDSWLCVKVDCVAMPNEFLEIPGFPVGKFARLVTTYRQGG